MGEQQSTEQQTAPAAVQLTEAEVSAFRQFQEAGGFTAFAELRTRAEAAEGRVAALETDARRTRFTNIVLGRAEGADGARWFGEVDAHVAHLVKLADAFGDESDEVTHYIALNTAHAEQLLSSDLLRETGTGRGPASLTPLAEVTQLAEAKRAANPALTREQAIATVYAERPELYERETAR
jgi:hypothetical protein